eukprot:2506095-Rhodomonas_salina.3
MESVKQDLHEDSGSGPAYDVRQEIDSLQKALRERIANSACAERLEKEQRARRPPLSRNSGAGFRPFAMPPEHLADAILVSSALSCQRELGCPVLTQHVLRPGMRSKRRSLREH